jgi:imidazolonepropionase-like amidohydrolase
MGTAYIVRQAMIDAEQYRDSWKRYEEKVKAEPDTQPPKRDLNSEAMLKVLNREIPVHIHCSRVDDIMTAVRLSEEFDFLRLSLGHAEEAYKVADELARRQVKVVVGPLMITYDDDGNLVNLAEVLVEHGVEISIMTDADVVQQEFLRYQAAIAVKYGLEFGEALKAITLNPAKLIGAEDRIGSLEVGKDADLVLFDGDPFDIQTKVVRTFINGKVVYSADQD